MLKLKNGRSRIMKKLFFLIIATLTWNVCAAQFDPLTTSLVYQEPGTEGVIIQTGIKYKTVNDTTLTFDIYYPPVSKPTDALPLVIFNNGVGGNAVPTWKVYKDWAKLAAVNGIVAVNHQSRNGKTLKDSEDLVDYLQQHASDCGLIKTEWPSGRVQEMLERACPLQCSRIENIFVPLLCTMEADGDRRIM
jgi:hypothetical protein